MRSGSFAAKRERGPRRMTMTKRVVLTVVFVLLGGFYFYCVVWILISGVYSR